jgi:hypothetical protein
MPVDPTITAALRAAAEAARIAGCQPGCCGEGTGCEVGPCHCAHVASAAAIAAFLRRAADVHAGCYVGMEIREALRHLAAAVEAAAHE